VGREKSYKGREEGREVIPFVNFKGIFCNHDDIYIHTYIYIYLEGGGGGGGDHPYCDYPFFILHETLTWYLLFY